jgi:hypothetical protein
MWTDILEDFGWFSVLKMEVIRSSKMSTYGLHGAMCHKMATFITATVRTSNPASNILFIKVYKFVFSVSFCLFPFSCCGSDREHPKIMKCILYNPVLGYNCKTLRQQSLLCSFHWNYSRGVFLHGPLSNIEQQQRNTFVFYAVCSEAIEGGAVAIMRDFIWDSSVEKSRRLVWEGHQPGS